jgi:hypothetical protein
MEWKVIYHSPCEESTLARYAPIGFRLPPRTQVQAFVVPAFETIHAGLMAAPAIGG